MKLNNKGFAISGVLYALLILFVTFFIGILTVLASTKFSLDKIRNDIKNKLELNTNINSDNSCIKDVDSICPNGTKVNVKVNSSENYNFYVINDTGRALTLIMDRNLGSWVPWISKEDYIAVGGTESDYGEYGNNNKGPLTAINVLEERTAGWTNVPSYNYTYTDDGGGNKFSSIIRENVRARLLTNTEATSLGCVYESNNSCPTYLYENTSSSNAEEAPLGYWLSSASSSHSYCGLHAGCGGYVGINRVYFESHDGLRPVITIYKTL